MAAKKVSIVFTYNDVKKTVSFFPPINRAELLDALRSSFGDNNIGALDINGEAFIINDKLITDVLLKDSSVTYKVFSAVAPKSGGQAGFDPVLVKKRLDHFWSLNSTFGVCADALTTYLDEVVSDRYALVNGVQLVRDELNLATVTSGDLKACGVDFSLPTVLTTCAYTNCGDRVQREATPLYCQVVGSRFATMAENGAPKIEMFSPAGGGTDNGFILAHVTVAHMMDGTIKKALYEGNPKSYYAVNIDLMSHVGRHDTPTCILYGRTKESPFREDRNACGAVIGTLTHYDDTNAVHRRLKANLGAANFEYLSKNQVILADGTNITYVIGAAIIVLQGMLDTCQALAESELDERGVAHLSATLTVNRVSMMDPIIYLGRATVFQKEIKFQGFGLDAKKFSGRVQDNRLILTYDKQEGSQFKPVVVPRSQLSFHEVPAFVKASSTAAAEHKH